MESRWRFSALVFALAALMFLGLEYSFSQGKLPTTKSTLDISLPEAVSHVTWTVSSDDNFASLVQISFPSVAIGKRQPELPKTQVWLLKADGTVIPPNGKPSELGIGMTNSITMIRSYSYKRHAASEAVAVAICIDGRYFVEALPVPQGESP